MLLSAGYSRGKMGVLPQFAGIIFALLVVVLIILFANNAAARPEMIWAAFWAVNSFIVFGGITIWARGGVFGKNIAPANPALLPDDSKGVVNYQQAGMEPAMPMVRLDNADQIIYANSAFKETFGHAPNSLNVLSGGRVIAKNTCQFLETATGPSKFNVIEYGDKNRGVEVYFSPVDDGLPQPISGGQDIFDDLPIALLKLEPTGQVIGANKAAKAKIGHKLAETQHINTLFDTGSCSAAEWLASAIAQPDARGWDFLHLKDRQENKIFQISLCDLTAQKDPCIIAALTDVTDLKSIEVEYNQNQKMQSIGELAGGVAHDFNNLLTAISGHCDLLLLRFCEDDAEYSDLMQIQLNANRAAALIGQLLSFSRKQHLEFTPINIRDLLSDLVHLLNRLVGEKIELVLAHGKDLGSISADPRHLEQVITNLVVNARDAMPDGGKVLIETKNCNFISAKERQGEVIPVGEYISIKIIDQGCGIAAADIDKIFEPFFTTKPLNKGTGLGLATAYGIIKQTGGYIFVDSKISNGTTFEILLAKSRPKTVEAIPMLTQKNNEQINQYEGNVLLVEDEAPVRAFASRALRMKGFNVFEAESGEEALEKLVSLDVKFDVFVSDVIMPGLDGPSWVEKAREDFPDTKVIYISGYAEDCFDDKKEGLDEAIFLPKPFSLKDLNRAVVDTLG